MSKIDLLITTGNYKPDIGGPATFLKGLENYLNKKNITFILVAVVSQKKIFVKENNIVKIKREIPYFLRIFITAVVIIIYRYKTKLWLSNTLEIETIIAKIITRKKVCGRIVGDRAWETSTNKELVNCSIDEFQTLKSKNFFIFILKIIRDLHFLILDDVVVPSRYLQSITKNWSKSKTQLIYNGVEDNFKKRKIEQKEVINFVCVARLVKWKGLGELVEILGNDNRLQLDIIGQGPEFEYLQNIKMKYSFNNINFLGKKNSNDVSNALMRSDVFILNSYYEGLSHVLIEACMHYLPIIARNSGGNSEVVSNNVNGYIFNNLDQLEICINKICNFKTRKKLSLNSRKIYDSKFNSEMTYKKYINLLKR